MTEVANINREIALPYTAVNGVFYAFRNGRLELAGDPRKLIQAEMTLDPRAIFSVLQFGAIIPPLTPWREIGRLPPGYRYRIRPDALPERGEPLPLDSDPSAEGVEDLDGRADRIEAVLDASLASAQIDLLLFSGGIDSGLMAARLAASGRRDVSLVNFAFGDSDPESSVAETMARHLGMRFERLRSADVDLAECLDEPGQVYPVPIGDMSVAPTSALARAVVARVARTSSVLDGTGADGAFGMGGKLRLWQRIGRIPRPLLNLTGMLQRSMWQREHRAERVTRLARRAGRMPLLAAVFARNPLAGLFYDDSHALEVNDLLERWLSGWPVRGFAQRAVAADMAFVCANIYAQKAQAIFDANDVRAVYPYMSPEMLGLGLRTVEAWAAGGAKAPLKRALARCVPAGLVYRPKSPFADPRHTIMRGKTFIGHLRGTVLADGPLREYLVPARFSRAAELLQSGARLPRSTLNCLWTTVFLDRWIRTVHARSS